MERIVVQRHFPKVNIPKLKRVAAYARVSSGKDAMLHSLSAQVSYYSDLIQKHSGCLLYTSLKAMEERLDKRNHYGNKDLTAYNAVQQIRTKGKAEIVLK